MIKIDIDEQVFEKLKEISIPFIEITPNLVIRRLLGLSNEGLVNIISPSEFYQKTSKSDLASQKDLSLSMNDKGFSRDVEISTIKTEPIRNKKRIIQQPVISSEEYPFVERIERLRKNSFETHPAFLTFLMDKYFNTEGNYQTKQITDFMDKMNLQSISGILRNPWMKGPYSGDKNGITSCQRTIEHFKQTRKFGCWGGKDIKNNCDASNVCQYHPNNESDIKNKCDLRKGVIWKRRNPDSNFIYGNDYLKIVKNELLKGKTIPLQPLLYVFYPDRHYGEGLVNQFVEDFHFTENEFRALFTK